MSLYRTRSPPPSNSPKSVQFRREHSRDIRINLQDLHRLAWGFAIFRTVFTPESDARFASFLAKLTTYVNYSIDRELLPDQFTLSTDIPLDNGPNEEMKRRYVNDIVEDCDLDGADIDIVRTAFAKWLQGQGIDIQRRQQNVRHQVCIMVDDTVLDTVEAAPEDPSDDDVLQPTAWVKVIQYIEPGEPEWQGWMKAGLNNLNYLWFQALAGQEIEDMFMAMAEHGEEVYVS